MLTGRPDAASSRWYVTAVFDPAETAATPPDPFWFANHLSRFFNAANVEVRTDPRMANVHLSFTTEEDPDQVIGRVTEHVQAQYGWTLTGVAYYSDGRERRSRRTAEWLRALAAVLPGE